MKKYLDNIKKQQKNLCWTSGERLPGYEVHHAVEEGLHRPHAAHSHAQIPNSLALHREANGARE